MAWLFHPNKLSHLPQLFSSPYLVHCTTLLIFLIPRFCFPPSSFNGRTHQLTAKQGNLDVSFLPYSNHNNMDLRRSYLVHKQPFKNDTSLCLLYLCFQVHQSGILLHQLLTNGFQCFTRQAFLQAVNTFTDQLFINENWVILLSSVIHLLPAKLVWLIWPVFMCVKCIGSLILITRRFLQNNH